MQNLIDMFLIRDCEAQVLILFVPTCVCKSVQVKHLANMTA